MKSLTLIIPLLALAILGCANGGGLAPISAESEMLAKTEIEAKLEEFPGHGPGGGLISLLELSEEQKAQIKEIMQRHREQLKAKHGSFEGRPSREAIKEKRREMRESLQKEIARVLTSDQQAKLDELKAQLERGEIPQELVERHVNRLSADLDLSEEQQSQVRALGLPHLPHRRHRDKESRGDFQQNREQLKEYEQKLMAILTPEQQSRFREIKKERREKFRSRLQKFGHHRFQKRLEHLTQVLNLDEEQQKQIAEIFQNNRPNRERFRGNRGNRNREEMQKNRRAQMEQIHAQIRSILTEEQLAKFEELLSKRRN
ncbi:MAG: hypothetical protein ACE5IR_05590 [bacterium]